MRIILKAIELLCWGFWAVVGFYLLVWLFAGGFVADERCAGWFNC